MIRLLILLIPLQLFADVLPMVPPLLKRGDTIAVIAPASPPDEDQHAISRVIKYVMDKGYRVKIAPNLMTRYGYLAGTDEERAKALMDAWADPDVKALWCWRGGFGCTRILDLIDFDVIRANPKILVGMSDITALHAAINKETGLVTYLGPNLNVIENAYNEKQAFDMITDPKPGPIPMPKNFPGGQNYMTITPGVCRGRLAGGTISLVSALVGTPWEPSLDGKILVLEEVDEQPYRIDRMLGQLKHAGLLDHLAGVILSSWCRCEGNRPNRSLSLEHVFRTYFADAKYPVLLGFPSGHIKEQATLPLGAMAELDATSKTLRIVE